MMADVLVGSFLLVGKARAPWNLADSAIIELLVVLNHIPVNFGPLIVGLLVLLVKLVAIRITLIVKFVHCFFVVPILVCLEVTTALLRTKFILTHVVLASISTLFLSIKIIDV